jgi:subtilisin-like proprotein convertase family protein
MYLKTRTWFLLSLVCFLGAVYFWRLGNERAARDKGPGSTNTNASPADGRRASSTNTPLPLLSADTTNRLKPELHATNAPFPYRISNTTRTIGDLVRSDSAILLRNALIDSTSGAPLEIPPHLRSQGDPGSYIVQARGRATDAFREQLKTAGAEIVSYVPNNAYLVRASAAAVAQLRAQPLTQSVMPWEPYFKLAPKLLALAVEQRDLPNGNPLSVLAFPGNTEAAERQLREMGATVMSRERTPFGTQLLIHAPADQLVSVAQLTSVQAIEPAYRRVLANDLARTRVRISTNTITPDTHLNRKGAGIRVGVNDTGVDATHPDLQGRIFGDPPGVLADLDGHGTHVAGIIASTGTSLMGNTNIPGSTNGASFRGMAPEAQIFAQPIDIISGPLKPDSELQEVAATNGVFICNNSWGYLGAFDYTSASAIWDSAVRDSVPGQPGSQALTYVFSAGNGGFGETGGAGGFEDTIGAPGTAKNVITVGATEQIRNITNEVVINGQTNTPFALETDSEDQVAWFSSRGNVGPGVEGEFGRFKPDVVAPGAFVVSTRANGWASNLNVFVSVGYLTDEIIPVGETNIYFFFGSPNAIEARIRVIPNGRSPVPFPTNSIYVRRGSPPPPSDFLSASNRLNFSPVADDIYYVGIGNNFNQDMHCDLQVIVLTTNGPTPGDQQLVALNQVLAPRYRYESGTSMAAPVVSGMLALMQEQLRASQLTNPSPALMKALLINGARSMGQYNLEVNKFMNFQGWGIANLTNSLPAHAASQSDRTQWPVRFFDQETNGLVTGESDTRIITLRSNTPALRISLVWTDPPGNPTVASKLVNDLDVIVTNLNTLQQAGGPQVYVGNAISGDFSSPLGTNFVTDVINNVENVYISNPGGSNRYSVTVRARQVNVNAVTAHNPDGIAQDYALVISAGSPGSAPVFTVDPVTSSFDTVPQVTTISNLSPVFDQRIGANPNLSPTTNGIPTQWRFFQFEAGGGTNTNVAVFTFLSPNLSRPRTIEEADIDLYVSLDPGLTNLNPAAIASAWTSKSRGGTEGVALTNQTVQRIYYIGVKSEDQQAASFGLVGFTGGGPFSERDEDGNVLVHGLGVPIDIPDGSSEQASGALIFAYCLEDIDVRNVIVTNILTHENGGDLIGLLNHNGAQSVLNNHRGFQGTVTFVYDDSNSGQFLNSIPTDLPGTLRNFWGQPGQGTWQMIMVDDSLVSQGRVENLTILLQPRIETNGFFTVPAIPLGRWFYTFVDVPPDGSKLGIDVIPENGPVELYVRHRFVPDQNNYDHSAVFNPPLGGTLEITPADSPPLRAGIYFIGLFNPGPANPLNVRMRIRLERNLLGGLTNLYRPSGAIPLLDDALTTSLLQVTNSQQIYDLRVGVRIEHQRASDLVLTLVSPAGTRILLAENRGGNSPFGYGGARSIGSPAIVMFDGFESAICGVGKPTGSVQSGWYVEWGDVDILCPPGSGLLTPPHSGVQALDLNGWNPGSISRMVPTSAGSVYTLSHVYCRNPFAGSGFVATGDVLIDGQVVSSLTYGNLNTQNNLNWFTNQVNFTAASALTQLRFNSTVPSGNAGMYLDTIQVSGPPDTNIYTIFTDNTNITITPIKFGIPPFTNSVCPPNTNMGGGGGVVVLNNGFDGPGCNFTVSAGGFVTGWRVEQGNIDVGCATPHTGTRWIDLNGDTAAIISTNLVTVPNTDYLLTFAYAKNPQTGNPNFVASCNVEIDGQTVRGITYALPNSIQNFNWQTTSIVFRASSASTLFRMVSTVQGNGGMYLDSFNVASIGPSANRTNCFGFLPEEPLTQLRGENAYGTWRLEVLDNRVGAPLNANLLSWQLEFDFVNTNVPPTVLSNGMCFTGIAYGTNNTYFRVVVPSVATTATNSLISSNGTVMVLGADINMLPVGVQPPDDYAPVLTSAPVPELVITTNSTPPLPQGRSYYVSVRNQTDTTNHFTLCVVFDRDDTNGLFFTNIISGQCITNTIEPTNILHYFQFDVDTNAVELTFELLGLTENADMVVSQPGSPPPNPTTFYKQSAQPGTTSELITETNYNFTLGGIWSIGVYNSTNVPVTYTLCVRQVIGIRYQNVDVCTNGALIPERSVRYFQHTVSPLALRSHFTVSNIVGGNVDMFVSAFPPIPPPSAANFLIAGTNPGTTPEIAALSWASTPQLIPGGTYFIAITNHSAIAASYSLCIYDFPGYMPLTNGVCFDGRLVDGHDAQYFVFNIASNAVRADFLTLGATGDIDLYLRQFPIPGPFPDYDYASELPGIGNETIVLTTNTSPFPLAPGDWYLAVVNRDAGPVDFCIQATQTGAPDISQVICTNALTIAPHAVQYFDFNVSSNALRVLFQITNILNGNVDMYIEEYPVPGVRTSNSSTNPGTQDEYIAHSRAVYLNVPSTFRIAVTNLDSVNVTYNLCVIETTNYTPLVNGTCHSNRLYSLNVGDGHYYSIDVASNAVQLELSTQSPVGDLDLYLRRVPIPGIFPAEHDYRSINVGNVDERIIVTTNSTPVPLGPGLWYAVVVANEPRIIDYCITARQRVLESAPPAGCTNLTIAAGDVRYFQFAVASNAFQVEFATTMANGDVDMYINPYPPLSLPGSGNAIRASATPGTGNESITLSSGSVPQLQAPGTYFIAITNVSAGPVSFRFCVTQTTNGIAVTNGVCVTNTLAALNDTHYYEVTIFPNSVRADFMTLDASGNVDLYVRRVSPPAPGPTSYNYRGENLGATNEIIVVTTGSPVPLAPGTWYIAVVNRDTAPVTYCMKVTQYPVLDPFDIRLRITNGWPARMDLGWNAFEFQRFHLEWTPALSVVPWQPFTNANGTPIEFGPVGGTGTNFHYRHQPLIGPMRFYRLNILP